MTQLRIIPCPTANQREALTLLLQRSVDEDPDWQVQALLDSAERSEMSLAGLLIADLHEQLVGAVMAVCQADGTAHVWPPAVTAHAPAETAVALVVTCRDWIARSPVTMAQCLTQLEDLAAQELLVAAGFERLTDVVCWQHELEEIPHGPLPEHCEVLQFSEAHEAHFQQVMQQTYADSQDCPGLRGRRTAIDSLAAHRLAADEASRLWQVYQCAGEDVGVVLCADHRDQRMWELLYLGVVPKFRRQGFGLAMLCQALWDAREVGAEGMFLAADDTNAAAANLYEAAGFQVAYRQRIHVWFPPGATGQSFTSYAQR